MLEGYRHICLISSVVDNGPHRKTHFDLRRLQADECQNRRSMHVNTRASYLYTPCSHISASHCRLQRCSPPSSYCALAASPSDWIPLILP